MREEVRALLGRLIRASEEGPSLSEEELLAETQRIGLTPEELVELREMLVANYRETYIMQPGWQERETMLRLLQGPSEEKREEV